MINDDKLQKGQLNYTVHILIFDIAVLEVLLLILHLCIYKTSLLKIERYIHRLQMWPKHLCTSTPPKLIFWVFSFISTLFFFSMWTEPFLLYINLLAMFCSCLICTCSAQVVLLSTFNMINTSLQPIIHPVGYIYIYIWNVNTWLVPNEESIG